MVTLTRPEVLSRLQLEPYLTLHAETAWPQLAGLHVRHRGQYAYVEGVMTDEEHIRLMPALHRPREPVGLPSTSRSATATKTPSCPPAATAAPPRPPSTPPADSTSPPDREHTDNQPRSQRPKDLRRRPLNRSRFGSDFKLRL